MRYILDERYLLRGWELLPWAVTDRQTGKTHFITAKEMDALKLCNGLIETDLPLIPQDVRELLPQIEKNGVIRPAREGENLMLDKRQRGACLCLGTVLPGEPLPPPCYHF